MARGPAAFFCILVLAGQTWRQDAVAAPPDRLVEEGWELVSDENGVRVHRRFSSGSNLVEAHATAQIPAPPKIVLAVLTEHAKYPDFMPHMVECRVVGKDGADELIFQRLRISRSFHSIVSDRYHVVRNRVLFPPDGRDSYRIEWAVDDAATQRYQVNDAIATRVNTGFWELEAADGSKATRLRYYLKADPGGWIPQSLANIGTVQSVPAVIEAVRQRSVSFSSPTNR